MYRRAATMQAEFVYKEKTDFSTEQYKALAEFNMWECLKASCDRSARASQIAMAKDYFPEGKTPWIVVGLTEKTAKDPKVCDAARLKFAEGLKVWSSGVDKDSGSAKYIDWIGGYYGGKE